jgi:hypothetical protein
MQYIAIATDRVPERSRGTALTSKAEACVLFTGRFLRWIAVYVTTEFLGKVHNREEQVSDLGIERITYIRVGG